MTHDTEPTTHAEPGYGPEHSEPAFCRTSRPAAAAANDATPWDAAPDDDAWRPANADDDAGRPADADADADGSDATNVTQRYADGHCSWPTNADGTDATKPFPPAAAASAAASTSCTAAADTGFFRHAQIDARNEQSHCACPFSRAAPI